jgi:galactokinase
MISDAVSWAAPYVQRFDLMLDLPNLTAAFQERFGSKPSRFFFAPGRVNLIGEHTDYNEGYVLPMALDKGTLIAANPRRDRRVRAYSAPINQITEFELDQPVPTGVGSWTDYIGGVAWILNDRHGSLTGADLAVASDLPIGAGLSSSAALELAAGLALASLSGLEIDRLALALIGQEAEHNYVGIKCGIMDQYVAAFGRRHNALLIDCRSLQSQVIPLRLDNYQIVVCDSHVKHELASSEYNQRRSECEDGVKLLQKAMPSIQALRDVGMSDFNRHQSLLPRTVRQRCRHVVTENERTLAAAEALKSGNLTEMGRLMTASHASLKNDYQVSCPELDLLVDSALRIEGVLGARLTGGGFGGCTVNLVHRESINLFRNRIAGEYERVFSKTPSIYIFEASDGAREIKYICD